MFSRRAADASVLAVVTLATRCFPGRMARTAASRLELPWCSQTCYRRTSTSTRRRIGRFANHSCAPHCYVAKWTVGDRVRMGIFAKRRVQKDEELTFNYNVDRYGHEAQTCYCGSRIASGSSAARRRPTWPAGMTPTSTVSFGAMLIMCFADIS